MKNILIISFTIISSLALGQTAGKNFIDQNFIEVIGTAEIQVVPDMIYLKIVISEKDTKNKVSVADMELQMTSRFKDMGIDVTKDLSIKDLFSFYKTKIVSKADVILSKEYQLLVHDGKTAGRVLEELEKMDISNASIDHVDHSKIEELRKDVKISAIKAAKDKAEYLTKSIGQTIGRAIYVDEIDNSIESHLRTANISYNYKGKEVDLDFEKIKLESSILVRFELK